MLYEKMSPAQLFRPPNEVQSVNGLGLHYWYYGTKTIHISNLSSTSIIRHPTVGGSEFAISLHYEISKVL